MRFDDIVNKLLSYPNTTITVKGKGVLFYENLHNTVRLYSKSVHKLNKKGVECDMMKAELLYIVENYKKLEKHAIGYKNR